MQHDWPAVPGRRDTRRGVVGVRGRRWRAALIGAVVVDRGSTATAVVIAGIVVVVVGERLRYRWFGG